MLVKKYSNRRLYDTTKSSYITLDELAEAVRKGADVQVVDAKSGADLTQQTLAQIILESRGASKLLPTPLLVQLIRMGDDALADFFGRYVTWSLEMYLQARHSAQAMANAGYPMPFSPPPNPFMGMGWNQPPWPSGVAPQQPPAPAATPTPPSAAPPEEPKPAPTNTARDEIAALRDEIAALKASLTDE